MMARGSMYGRTRPRYSFSFRVFHVAITLHSTACFGIGAVNRTKSSGSTVILPLLGINPNVDGKIIRLNMPPLSEEQRKKLVGLVKEKAEAAKVAIRNVRRDANKHADQGKTDKTLTEDDVAKLKDEIQEQTKEHEKNVDDVLKEKVDELMTV